MKKEKNKETTKLELKEYEINIIFYPNKPTVRRCFSTSRERAIADVKESFSDDELLYIVSIS